MKLFFALSFFLLCAVGTVHAQNDSSSPVDLVNPLMGSDSNFSLSNGNTYPAIALPWGMNFWTPQTARMGDGWVYAYDATHIQGIK
jgi:putative alpha-1,2-mannosidase